MAKKPSRITVSNDDEQIETDFSNRYPELPHRQLALALSQVADNDDDDDVEEEVIRQTTL